MESYFFPLRTSALTFYKKLNTDNGVKDKKSFVTLLSFP